MEKSVSSYDASGVVKEMMGSEFFKQFFLFLGHRCVEVRIVDYERRRVLKHYLNVSSAREFAEICQKWNGKAQIYVSVQERDGKGGKSQNVTCVRWVFIDIDAKRPDKMKPATEEQLENAKRNTDKIIQWLRENGIEPTLVINSGNGYQLLIRINDTPVNDENRQVLNECINYGLLEFIRRNVVDDTVEIDSVGDLPRMMGVPGTFNIKAQRVRKIIQGDIYANPEPQLAMEALIQNLYENYLEEKRRKALKPLPTVAEISEEELLAGMCPARRELWIKGAPVGQRSHAIHYMTIHLARRGLSKEKIIALLREWDQRTGMKKFTDRSKDMYEYDYEKTMRDWPFFGELDVSCDKMREHGFCTENHREKCLKFIHGRRLELWNKIKAIEERSQENAAPDFNLNFEPETLINNCKALRNLVERINRNEQLNFDEREVIYLTLLHLGEKGRNKIVELMNKCVGAELDHPERRIKRYMKEGYFPISCQKIRRRLGLCGNCQGATTPVDYVFGGDPNKAEVTPIKLHQLNSKLLNTFVGVPVLIAGIGETYSVPYILQVYCVNIDVNKCRNCPLFGGELLTLDDLRIEINPSVDLTIDLIGVSETKINLKIRSYLNKYAQLSLKCTRSERKIEFKVLKERTITPLIVYPQVGKLEVKEGWAGQSRQLRVYLKEHLETAHIPGILYGCVRRNPKTAELTIIASIFKPLALWLQKERFTEEEKRKMNTLRKIDYNELIKLIGTHVCGIIGRDEAVEAVLLAYHTPLYFVWKNKIEPGWVHVVLFGDTTTGKRIPREIRHALGLGTYVVMETASRTGLLYSIQYVEKRRPIVVLGEFALADKALLIIDGFDKMHKEEKREFSEAYRTGVLKVRRDAKLDAPMRVRLITCENVQKPMSHYMYPCSALLDNYTPPDIARIDLAVPFRAEDVPAEKFMRKWEKPPENLNEIIEALRLNVTWAWNIPHEKIKFTAEAENLIYEKAREFDSKYGSSRLPLVSKDMDKKIAKLSIAHAILTRSIDDEDNVIVKKDHVEHVTKLIDRIYSGEAMRLDQYVETEKERTCLSDQEFQEIYNELIKAEENKFYPIFNVILRELELRGTTQLNELQAVIEDELGTESSQSTIKRRISILKTHRLVISSRRGYSLTPKGIAFLHRYKKQKRK